MDLERDKDNLAKLLEEDGETEKKVRFEQEEEGMLGGGSIWKKYRGLGLSVLSSLVFSFTFLIVKYLQQYHPMSISVWRHGAILIPSLLVLVYFKFAKDGFNSVFGAVFPLKNRERAWLLLFVVLRAIFGATSLLLHVWSLKFLSVGDSSIFSFSSPIFVVIFAAICLGEKCGFVPIGVALLTLFGIGLIVRPPILTGQTSFDTENLTGVALALISQVFNSAIIIILRRIRKVHWLLILIFLGLLGILENMIVAAALGVLILPIGLKDSIITYLLMPFTVWLGQISIMLALKFEEAGPVALVGTSGVIFSFILQFLFFGVSPDIYSILGGTIVILGVMITTLRKWTDELPADDKRRKTFRILLY